jgi:hypothetical protein
MCNRARCKQTQPGNDEACGGQLGGDRTIVAQDATGRLGVMWRKVRPDSIRQ